MSEFEGSFECALDEKDRLTLPMKLRKVIPAEAGDTFTLAKGTESCIRMHPQHLWNQKVQILKQKLNPFSPDEQQFLRNFSYLSHKVTLDKQNRFLVTSGLLKHAKIEKNVVLIGMYDSIEIWCPEVYEAYDANFDAEKYSAIAAKLMGGM